jgi:hypothetical protein
MPAEPQPAGPVPTTGHGQRYGYRMKPFDPVRGLKWLGAFGGFGISVSALYAATGVGFPCPLVLLTGWECPLCGGTRLGSALLHGEIGQAFHYNPAVFVMLALFTLLAVLWVVEMKGGPKVRPPRAIGERLVRVHPTRWTVTAVAFGLAYTVARNLL